MKSAIYSTSLCLQIQVSVTCTITVPRVRTAGAVINTIRQTKLNYTSLDLVCQITQLLSSSLFIPD